MELQLALAGVVGLLAGISIGCVGVGGVIVVPVLVQLGGVPIHAAIAAAMSGFIVTGAVGTLAFARHGSLAGRAARPLLLAAMPAAAAGAFAAQAAPVVVLELVIAVFTAASGAQILLRRRAAPEAGKTIATPTGVAVGLIAGLLSALTGTGGAAVLLPLLFWLEVPVLTALGLAQAIQLAVAVPATLGNVVAGAVPWQLGLTLGLGLALGAWIGASLAHRLDQALLRRLVAVVLLAVGLAMLGRVIFRHL